VKAGWLVVCALAACGRVRFDPVAALGDDTTGDGAVGGDGTPSATCNAPGVLLCDGFEPGGVAWQTVIGNGAVDFTSERVHSGTRALRAEGITGRTVAFAAAPIATVAEGEIHLRGFFNRAATATASEISLSRVGDGVGNSEFFGVASGSLPGVDAGPQGIYMVPPLPADAWACVELHVAGGEVAIDVDGAPRISVALDAFGPYAEVAFGVVRDNGTPDQYLVFVDDVVASTQPIGCDL